MYVPMKTPPTIQIMFQLPPKVPLYLFTGIRVAWLNGSDSKSPMRLQSSYWGCPVYEGLTGAKGSPSKLTQMTFGRWLQFLVLCFLHGEKKNEVTLVFMTCSPITCVLIMFIRRKSLSLTHTQQGRGGLFIHMGGSWDHWGHFGGWLPQYSFTFSEFRKN